MFCTSSFAAGTTVLDSIVQHLIDWLTGNIARGFAVLAIVSLGFATFKYGKVSKEKGVSIIIGIGLVFGAASILNMLGVGA